MTGAASIAGAARESRFGDDISAIGSAGGSTLSGSSGATHRLFRRLALGEGRNIVGHEFSVGQRPGWYGSAISVAAVATGAGGRTTELVVSFDGFRKSSASMPDVDVQPARHSDASKKLTTPGNPHLDLYAKHNRPRQ